MPWDWFLAAGGVCFLVLMAGFGAMGLDAGVYGLLFLACAGIVLLSILDLGWALVAGMFAVPLLSIQFLLPWGRLNIAFDKVFIVAFSFVWAARYLRPGTLRRYFWEWRAGFAWSAVLFLLAASAALSWAGGSGISPLDILEPSLSALFFVAAFDVLSREKELFSRLMWALVLSGALVLLGAAAQVISQSMGIRPPRLALLPGMDQFPSLPLFSTIVHPNYYAVFVGVVLVLAFGFLAHPSRHGRLACAWTVVCGLVTVMVSRSLAGMLIVSSILVLTFLLVGLSSRLRWISGAGFLVLLAAFWVWGLPKLERGNSYLVRAYVYKTVIPEIWEKFFFGAGPGSFAAVFRKGESKIKPDDRLEWRRMLSDPMIRTILRPGEGGVTLTAGKAGAVRLEYDMVNAGWTKREGHTSTMLAGISASARIKAEYPGKVRLFIFDGGRYLFSPYHGGKGEEEVLTAHVPYQIRNYEGWSFPSVRSGLSVVEAPGRDGELSGILLRGAPTELRFNLKSILKGNTDLLKGKAVAAGAWIKVGGTGSQDAWGKVRLQITGGVRSYHGDYHPGDGQWRFLSVNGKVGGNEEGLLLDVNIGDGSPPVQVDGIFFDDGEAVVKLTPGEGQAPPADWPIRAITGVRPVVPVGEFARRSGGEVRASMRLRGGPLELEARFYLTHLLRRKDFFPEGGEVAVGAWIRAGRPSAREEGRKVRLQLVTGQNSRYSNYYSDYYSGDGRWQFLSAIAKVGPDTREMILDVEVAGGSSPAEIGEVFVRDGTSIIRFTPDGRQAPPADWVSSREKNVRPVLSLDEYAKRFGREDHPRFLVQGAPFEARFYLRIPGLAAGGEIRAGAWIRSRRQDVRLQLVTGGISYYSAYHSGNGQWQFLSAVAKAAPGTKGAVLDIESEKARGPSAEIGSVFFHDGISIIRLKPYGRQAPPAEWAGTGGGPRTPASSAGTEGGAPAGIGFFGSPLALQFDLSDLWRWNPAFGRGGEVAAGAWVQTAAPTLPGRGRKIRLRVTTGSSVYYSDFHAGTNQWQFLAARGKTSPEEKLLRIELEAAEGSGPVQLGGLFFFDGTSIVLLNSGGRQSLPEDWARTLGDPRPIVSLEALAGRGEVEERPGILFLGAPLGLEYDLGEFLKGSAAAARREEVAAGAWVKAEGPTSPGGEPRVRLRLEAGPASYSSESLPRDGRWHFLQARGRVRPDARDLMLLIEAGAGSTPIQIDGVFYDNGDSIVGLMPESRRLPLPVFSKAGVRPVPVIPMNRYRKNEAAGLGLGKEAFSRLMSILIPSAPGSGRSSLAGLTPRTVVGEDGGDSQGLKSLLRGWRAGVAVERGGGPVRFNRLDFDFSAVATARSSSWPETRRPGAASGGLENDMPAGWKLHVDGWGRHVDPSLSAHSVYLLVFVERGLLGLLALCSLLVILGIEIFSCWKTDGTRWCGFLGMALLAVLISSLVEDTLMIARYNLLFWVLAAAALSRRREASAEMEA